MQSVKESVFCWGEDEEDRGPETWSPRLGVRTLGSSSDLWLEEMLIKGPSLDWRRQLAVYRSIAGSHVVYFVLFCGTNVWMTCINQT